MPLTLDTLRRYAVARTLFAPTTLAKAIVKLGFVSWSNEIGHRDKAKKAKRIRPHDDTRNPKDTKAL